MEPSTIVALLESSIASQVTEPQNLATVKFELRDPIETFTDLFPVLYKRTKNGNIAWYAVSINYSPSIRWATVCYEKASGIGYKSQIDYAHYDKGVNIGKANETSWAEQAFFDAQSAIRNLKDQGYKEGIPAADMVHNTDADGDLKPMLAQSFNPDKPSFPYLVQPKLNGVRAQLVVEELKKSKRATLKSRGGKFYTVPEHILKAAIKYLPQGVYDGEIYRHGWKLQRITSAVKKHTADTEELVFVCYDMIMLDVRQSFRWDGAQEAFRNIMPFDIPLDLCETDTAKDMETLIALNDIHTKNGYEGSMLRNPDGLYRPGFRSKDLLKLKEMIDCEYKIVGVVSAKGRNEGCAVFVCEQEAGGKQFNVNPEGTMTVRRQYYKDRKKLIGKSLTVRFQEYSEEMTPIFPVGVAIRDYE